jgi:hypothetical protein
MMRQPIDDGDGRFYAAETLRIPSCEGRCAVLGAPGAVEASAGRHAWRRVPGAQPQAVGLRPSLRHRAHRARRTGVKRP